MIRKNKQNKMFRSRKAVSPLIATVLLIAFAVALGAVVMNWGRGYVEDTANIARERSDIEVTCASQVDIDIVDIDNIQQVCYNTTANPDNISMIVENKGSQPVEKIMLRLIGSATRVPLNVDLEEASNLTVNQAKYLSTTYNASTFGTPSQVKLTPYIKVGGTEVSCPASSAIATNIKPCSEIW
jgi:flagellin-like protein